jgi:hypothetical protein
MNGVPTPVLSPSPIATGFGFLPTPDRTYSPSKGNPAIRSLFPSVTQPNYIDPKCLAAVPGRPTDVLEFRPDLAKPLGLWEEATRVESAPPETWTALSPSDPYLFPRLTKNERCAPVHPSVLFSSHITEQRSPDYGMVLHPQPP